METGIQRETMETLPDWPYNPLIGNTAYIQETVEPDEIRILTGRPGSVTGIFRIRPDGRDRFALDLTLYHLGGVKDDIERKFTGMELGTLFDTPNFDVRASDPAYAALVKAEYAVPGHFVRTDDFAAFPNPGTGTLGDAVFYFRVRPGMTEKVDRLIRTGKVF